MFHCRRIGSYVPDLSPLDQAFYPDDQLQVALMKTPKIQPSKPERLDDRTPQRDQHGLHEPQEPSSENAPKVSDEESVNQEEKMDHEDTKDPVLRIGDAGDYFGDPTPRISRLTTLLAAQGARKMLENTSAHRLKQYEDLSFNAPKAATSADTSRPLYEPWHQPEFLDVSRSWRPSSEQAQNDALCDDSGDSMDHFMSKLEDLTIQPARSQRCRVCTACEHSGTDSADILGPVAHQLEVLKANTRHAETPGTVSGDEPRDTDLAGPTP
ncbi:uncharacterized protein LOC142768631 isoform X1 [Rhipicephalus microplus]|uniref:uncharacterized protein LOC142768631 isoform X1 n=2 Tax=Rhipicephalus microplus TaxID=6941 RepID=UPI003F6B39D3